MKVTRRAIVIAALAATSLSPAFAAHHRAAYPPYGYSAHPPVRIVIHPARPYPARPYIDFSRYIDPLSGMYCHNTGWATTCVPPGYGWSGVDCVAAWPFPACTRF
jgi:hypothetical protein